MGKERPRSPGSPRERTPGTSQETRRPTPRQQPGCTRPALRSRSPSRSTRKVPATATHTDSLGRRALFPNMVGSPSRQTLRALGGQRSTRALVGQNHKPHSAQGVVALWHVSEVPALQTREGLVFRDQNGMSSSPAWSVGGLGGGCMWCAHVVCLCVCVVCTCVHVCVHTHVCGCVCMHMCAGVGAAAGAPAVCDLTRPFQQPRG